MEQDFEIELQGNEAQASASMQLPLNFISVGAPENENVKVYIKQDIYKALEKLSASDTTKELGSILLGRNGDALGKTHVVISAYIEAKYTDASASTLTFTHKTWEYVHKEQELKYPNDKIIGWQHTHPSYGIFLSNYDIFIQENFFNMPFQIAYVIDPVQNERGFFCWKNGKIEKLSGFYVYDDLNKPIKIAQKKPPEQQTLSQRRTKAVPILLTLLFLFTVGLAAFTGVIFSRYQEQLAVQKELTQRVDQQKELLLAQEEKLSALQQQATADNDLMLSQKVDELTLLVTEHEAELSALRADQEPTVRFVAYIVKSGDSISSICAVNGINYDENRHIILAVNGISDPNLIYPGQKLLLPKEN